MDDKEKGILAALSKQLGVDVTPKLLESREEKRLKEQKLLSKWSKLLGEPEPVVEVVEVIPTEQIIKEEKILASLSKILETPKEPIVEEIPPIEEPVVTEEPLEEASPFLTAVKDNAKKVTQPVFAAVEKQPELPEKDFITKSVVALSKTTKKTDNKDIPNDPVSRDITFLKKSVADLHSFASRISQMGGGGAGDITQLDHSTRLVTGDYTATNKDYYIGVNSPTPCTIVLPPNKKNGRLVVVKDESGHCATNHITINAHNGDTIDNDTSAIMAINNMTLQFIYRNGWRIM